MNISQAIAKTPIALLILVGALTSLIGPVGAQVSDDQVRRQLETRYGVSVLRIHEIMDRNRPALAVTFMNPAGNFNEALQVNTVVVDRQTGKLVPQYRQGKSGLRLAAPDVVHRTHPKLADAP